MIKNQVGRPRGNAREKLLEAAFECVRAQGYAAASSRTISALAGVNSSLLFYYFPSVDDLLVESLARSNDVRLDRYREAAEVSDGLSELIRKLGELFRADVATGHVRVVSELVAASIARAELRTNVNALMDPWFDLAEATVDRVLHQSPLRDVVDARDVATGVVTFYLGANLMTELRPDRADAERLLARAEAMGALIDALGPLRAPGDA